MVFMKFSLFLIVIFSLCLYCKAFSEPTKSFSVNSTESFLSVFTEKLYHADMQDGCEYHVELHGDIVLGPGDLPSAIGFDENSANGCVPFRGVFVGYNHSITIDLENSPFEDLRFGSLFCGIRIAEFKDLTLKGSYYGEVAAALTAYASGTVMLSNVKSDALVRASRVAGGLIGIVRETKTVNLTDCEVRNVVSLLPVSSSTVYAGGFIGLVHCDEAVLFDKCRNFAEVASDDLNSGGVYLAGFVGGVNQDEKTRSVGQQVIPASHPPAESSSRDTSFFSTSKKGSKNENDEFASLSFGSHSTVFIPSKIRFENCMNNGTVICKGSMCNKSSAASGFVAVFDYAGSSISFSNCMNLGGASGFLHAGGLIGRVGQEDFHISVTKTQNSGSFSECTQAGGFIGLIKGSGELSFTAALNTGDVFDCNYCGGFVGIVGLDSSVTVVNSENIGRVEGGTACGFMCSNSRPTLQIANVVEHGDVIGFEAYGITNVECKNCNNMVIIGDVKGKQVGYCPATSANIYIVCFVAKSGPQAQEVQEICLKPPCVSIVQIFNNEKGVWSYKNEFGKTEFVSSVLNTMNSEFSDIGCDPWTNDLHIFRKAFICGLCDMLWINPESPLLFVQFFPPFEIGKERLLLSTDSRASLAKTFSCNRFSEVKNYQSSKFYKLVVPGEFPSSCTDLLLFYTRQVNLTDPDNSFTSEFVVYGTLLSDLSILSVFFKDSKNYSVKDSTLGILTPSTPVYWDMNIIVKRLESVEIIIDPGVTGVDLEQLVNITGIVNYTVSVVDNQMVVTILIEEDYTDSFVETVSSCMNGTNSN